MESDRIIHRSVDKCENAFKIPHWREMSSLSFQKGENVPIIFLESMFFFREYGQAEIIMFAILNTPMQKMLQLSILK